MLAGFIVISVEACDYPEPGRHLFQVASRPPSCLMPTQGRLDGSLTAVPWPEACLLGAPALARGVSPRPRPRPVSSAPALAKACLICNGRGQKPVASAPALARGVSPLPRLWPRLVSSALALARGAFPLPRLWPGACRPGPGSGWPKACLLGAGSGQKHVSPGPALAKARLLLPGSGQGRVSSGPALATQCCRFPREKEQTDGRLLGKEEATPPPFTY